MAIRKGITAAGLSFMFVAILHSINPDWSSDWILLQIGMVMFIVGYASSSGKKE